MLLGPDAETCSGRPNLHSKCLWATAVCLPAPVLRPMRRNGSNIMLKRSGPCQSQTDQRASGRARPPKFVFRTKKRHSLNYSFSIAAAAAGGGPRTKLAMTAVGQGTPIDRPTERATLVCTKNKRERIEWMLSAGRAVFRPSVRPPVVRL